MVDPRHFKNFIAVIDSGGIRQAARVVHLSPSSISRSIQFLEEHFGVRLLERQGMHLIPTLHGETLRKEAKGVLSGYES
ncbi:MAG: LysR family transcriptional regulator, partial [Verrucomicrobiales bacterium]